MTKLVTIDLDDPAVLEALAATQHEIWAHWMRYLFSLCQSVGPWTTVPQEMPRDKVECWQRQLDTTYCERDLEQAVKVLAALAPLGQPVYCVQAPAVDPEDHARMEEILLWMQTTPEDKLLSREAMLDSPYDASQVRRRVDSEFPTSDPRKGKVTKFGDPVDPYDAGAGGLVRLRRRSHE